VYGVFPQGDRRRRPIARLPRDCVVRLISTGALRPVRENDTVALTDEGRALVRRLDRAAPDSFRAQHMDLAPQVKQDDGDEDVPCQVNLAESPLAWLARRTGRNGDPLISSRELMAGERLRADFHRARFIGRVTSDWTAPPRGSSARGPGRGQLEPAEAVIAARDRIARAMRDVGPALDRLLSAVCLEGRGLDDVERGFGWPRRSGKVVLKIALARLADHYGLPADR
jgi:hypothetical protein